MALNKIVLSDGVTELANVKSVVFHEAVNADEDLRPGCVGSASIEVDIFNSQANAVAAGDVVYCYQIDKNDVETLLGQFVCEPKIDTKNSYSFTAYDNAQKLNADFSQWLRENQSAFPLTVYQLVSSACAVSGVTLGSSSWGLSTQSVGAFYADGITCRDILSYAAEIGCCFVRCHTDGNIYFDWYSANAKTIGPTIGTNRYAYKQEGLTYSNYTTTALARVAVHPSGEDDVAYIYPTGVTSGNTLHIKNNLLLTGADASFYEAVAQQVYTVMSALGTYRPMTANLFAKENPFRAGDIVSVTDSQGVTFNSVVMDMSVSPSGAVLISTGREVYGEYSLEMAKQLVQLAADIVRINKLKVDWAEINQAIINYLTANNVAAQNLTIVDENGNVLATYGSSGITLGNSNEVHAEIDFNSFQLYDKDGNLYTSIGDARDASGLADVVCTQKVDGINRVYNIYPDANDPSEIVVSVNGTVLTSGYTASYSQIVFDQKPAEGSVVVATYKTSEPFYQYLFGTLKSGTELGYYSFASGLDATSSGYLSSSIGGSRNSATGDQSAVFGGQDNVANDRDSAVIGGYQNTAEEYSAVVVGGRVNYASGGESGVVSGFQNHASGGRSVVLGGASNEATGVDSAVLAGQMNDATGEASVTLGGKNIAANHKSQVVFGEYNVADPSSAASTARGNYIEIVGNGTGLNARSNARTLDWDGNETLSGGLKLGGNLEIDNTSPGEILKNTAMDVTDSSYTQNNSMGFRLQDKNGKNVAIITDRYLSNGSTGLWMTGWKNVNGSNIANTLALYVDNNGNRVVDISDAVPWLSVLGLGTSGALPITPAQGGTGETSLDTFFIDSKTSISTVPSSADALMNYPSGAYRVVVSGSQTVFPGNYGIMEVITAADYGMIRFTKVNSSETKIYVRTYNTTSRTWYDTSWRAIGA